MAEVTNLLYIWLIILFNNSFQSQVVQKCIDYHLAWLKSKRDGQLTGIIELSHRLDVLMIVQAVKILGVSLRPDQMELMLDILLEASGSRPVHRGVGVLAKLKKEDESTLRYNIR